MKIYPPLLANTANGVFEWQMHAHHMTPRQLGELAKPAEVKRVVITHFVPNPTGPEQARGYLNAIHALFPGDVQLGADLGRYQEMTTDEALGF